MTRIGFLIPEFPGQTHAFFMRERNELMKLGVETKLLSTRTPRSDIGYARHKWAKEARAQTTYLAPMAFSTLILAVGTFVLSGPLAWWRCFSRVFGKSDLALNERLKLFQFIIAGAQLKRVCAKEQLMHVHVHSFANATNVAMFAKLMGGPTYSATLHGHVHGYGNNQEAKWSNAAFAIVITKELIAEIRGLVDESILPPIYLAPMGVDLDDFQRNSLYVPPNKGEGIKLVSCGRLNYGKAHDDLIRVVAMLRDKGIYARLRICGAPDFHSQGYFNELKELRKQLDVEQQVEFLGSVSESDVKAELEGAHFFCLASLNEGIGVATMEAMAMKIPAIVSKSPGVEEMIEQDVDGVMVEPRNPDGFVDVITRLIENPEEAEQIALCGRRKVEQKFYSGVSASMIAQGLEAQTKSISCRYSA